MLSRTSHGANVGEVVGTNLFRPDPDELAVRALEQRHGLPGHALRENETFVPFVQKVGSGAVGGVITNERSQEQPEPNLRSGDRLDDYMVD